MFEQLPSQPVFAPIHDLVVAKSKTLQSWSMHCNEAFVRAAAHVGLDDV